MRSLGISTIYDLAHCDLQVLRTHLGDKYAVLIHRYANGIDDSPVAEKEPLNKGYGNSITLSRDVDDYETAFQVLLSLCETVGTRLRQNHVLCSSVCVELKDWKFRSFSHQAILKTPTDSSTVLYENACQLLKDFWDLTPVRLIGVRASKISNEEFVQMDLFDTKRNEKLEHLEKAIDSIREKYGMDSIKRASFLKEDAIVSHAVGKGKKMKSDKESLPTG